MARSVRGFFVPCTNGLIHCGSLGYGGVKNEEVVNNPIPKISPDQGPSLSCGHFSLLQTLSQGSEEERGGALFQGEFRFPERHFVP